MCQKKTLNTHAIRDSIYKLFTRRSKSSSSNLYERDGQKEDDEGIARLFSILDRYETTMKERYGTIRKISNEQILQDIIYECKLTNSLSSTGYGTSRSMNKRNEVYDDDALEDKQRQERNTNTKYRGSDQWMSNLEEELEIKWEMENGGVTRAGLSLLKTNGAMDGIDATDAMDGMDGIDGMVEIQKERRSCTRNETKA